MSDERLRQLERTWRETGAVEDEAAWLRERVRVGDLLGERLELAAFCGHHAARLVLGTGLDDGLLDLEPWLHGLADRSEEACVRAACAAGEYALERWTERFPDDRRPHDAVAAIRAWLNTPRVDDGLTELLSEAEDLADLSREAAHHDDSLASRAARAIMLAARTGRAAASTLHVRARLLRDSLIACASDTSILLADGEVGVQPLMARALVEWALT